MTQEHPITPPPGLIKAWCASRIHEKQNVPLHVHVATKAARWGADQELEACCAAENTVYGKGKADWLRSWRRPKPPSLKERALTQLDSLHADLKTHGLGTNTDTIRRALEQLDD